MRPDYGTRLKADGYDSPHVEHFFYGLPIRGFDALGTAGQYTLTTDATYAGMLHCLSLDFGPRILAAILAALPPAVARSIDAELQRDPNSPKQFNFPHEIHCASITATLGGTQQGRLESFTPMIVRDISLGSPSTVTG